MLKRFKRVAAVLTAVTTITLTGCLPPTSGGGSTGKPVNAQAYLGIDVYNGNSDSYNYAVARQQGVSFVIHKASQGWIGGPGGWQDWKFLGSTARERAAGLLTGGYHWLLRGCGACQADNFYNALRAAGGPNGMLAAVDVERNDWDQSLNPDAGTLGAFLTRWNQLTGNHPILIYSADWYWGYYFGEPRYFANYPLWWAGYNEPYGAQPIQAGVNNVTPGYLSPFGGWSGYAIRQWTSKAIVSGVQSDGDVFYGSWGQLLALTVPPNSTPVPPQAGTPAAVAWAKLHRFDQEPGVKIHDVGHPQAVKDLQMALNAIARKHLVNVSGNFDEATWLALVGFQQFWKSPGGVDGIAGPLTWGSLASVLTYVGR